MLGAVVFSRYAMAMIVSRFHMLLYTLQAIVPGGLHVPEPILASGKRCRMRKVF
jgi:hypothetical protein